MPAATPPSLPPERAAARAPDKSGAVPLSPAGPDKSGAVRIAPAGADRSGAVRIAPAGADKSGAVRIAPAGADKSGAVKPVATGVPTAATGDASAAVTAPTRAPAPLPPAPRAPAPEPERRRFVRVDTDPGSAHLDVRGVRAPLVGRAPQLNVLRDVVARAVDFQAPQLVTVVGNQGTGKSRLIAELVAGIKPPVRVFHGRAKADGERYTAVASLLRDRFQLAPGEVDGLARQRFAAEVKDVMGDGQVVEVLHFLGSFVGIDFPPSPFLKVLAESPRQHDEIARTVLRRFLEVDAHASPLVLVLDDLQWADDATLSLLSELASGLGGSSVVILASTRPEMLVRSPGWGGGAVDHERVDLRNLEPDDAEAMFRQLLARCGPIPDDIADAATEMTGGNPAFLEQLVRLFLDNGTIDASWADVGARRRARGGGGAADLGRGGDRGPHRRARARRARAAREGRGVRQRLLAVRGDRADPPRAGRAAERRPARLRVVRRRSDVRAPDPRSGVRARRSGLPALARRR